MASAPTPAALDRIAEEALSEVAGGMRLGLGTGRAAEAFIVRLAAKISHGLVVRCVTTSNRSEKLARDLGIPLETLDTLPELDVAFDGADEVTPDLQLTKGLGGALLRERVVAHAAARFVVLVTPEKLVDKLGSRTHIPIEVVPFAKPVVMRALAALGGSPAIRLQQGSPYHTDNGNLIADTRFPPIDHPSELDTSIRAIPGVVDTGLFLGMADVVLVGSEGSVQRLERTTRS